MIQFDWFQISWNHQPANLLFDLWTESWGIHKCSGIKKLCKHVWFRHPMPYSGIGISNSLQKALETSKSCRISEASTLYLTTVRCFFVWQLLCRPLLDRNVTMFFVSPRNHVISQCQICESTMKSQHISNICPQELLLKDPAVTVRLLDPLKSNRQYDCGLCFWSQTSHDIPKLVKHKHSDENETSWKYQLENY